MNIYYDVEDNHYRTYPDGDIASIDQIRELIENKNVSIVKLQQENKKLNGAIQTYDILLKSNIEENKKLKVQIEEYQKALDETMSEKIDIENNWNKLREYIISTRYEYGDLDQDLEDYDLEIEDVLNKMTELEQGDLIEK